MARPDIENISSSIVREYLNRKGLVLTLRAMDEEMPRTEASFNKRATLAREAHLDKLMKRNKDQPEPLRTMLEVMLRYHIERMSRRESDQPSTSSYSSGGSVPGPTKDSSSPARHAREDSGTRPRASDARVKERVENLDFDGLPQSDTGHSYKKEEAVHVTMEDEADLRRVPTHMLKQSEALARDRDPAAVVSTDAANRKGHRLSSSARSRVLGGPVTSNIDSKKSSKRSSRGIAPPNFSPPGSSTVMSPGLRSPDETKSRLRDFGFSFQGEKETTSGGRRETRPAEDSPALTDEPDLLTDLGETRSRTVLGGTVPTRDTRKKEATHDSKMEDRPSSSRKSKQGVNSISETPTETKKKKESMRSPKKQLGDLEMDDVDDIEFDLRDVRLGPSIRKSAKYVDARPLSMKKASELKNLIFGSLSGCFNEEWMRQGFPFNDRPELEFGIVQHKGGPCGILASVQARFLSHLLFTEDRTISPTDLRSSKRERSQCLAKALATTLWQAGGHKRAVVAMPSGKNQFTTGGKYKADGLTETLILYHFASLPDLEDYLSENVGVFLSSTGSGVVIFLYSLIFSKSLEGIIDDMDEPTNRLMGHHNYCTQEMVNLVLTGRAVSNTFNDVVELDSGSGPKCILKGIDKRSDIGLLSLFEHYDSCKVGSYYKTPRYPVWVLCSESHFSVIFSLKRNLLSDWKAERNFDLFYYDGLANQEELIRLSVNTIAPCPPAGDNDLVPPIEHCIRTKWPEALIDWNGTEPIL